MTHLAYLFAIPFVGAAVVFFASALSAKKLKSLAAGLSLIPLILLLAGNENWLGEEVNAPWFTPLSIHFHLSIDALSLLFLYLAAIVIPIALSTTPTEALCYPRIFYGFVLVLQGLLIGFFTARDLVVFTLFWEAMLLPLYFIISIWGGAERKSASLKFLIYMIAGSALMIAAVLFLYVASIEGGKGTFDIDALSDIAATLPQAPLLCGVLLLAFAVKTPLFPFHAWLPDAYCQAPASGTILLAGILSKVGIYGIARIAIPFFPEIMEEWSPVLIGLSIAGVLYGGLAAWMQRDFKRLIAYSSFSHINFILLGLFVWNGAAQTGAILQALNHGVTITALFLVASWLEIRLGSTSLEKAGGLAKYLPQLCWVTLFFALSSAALPGTNNFIGELMILYGLFLDNGWLAAIAGLTIILSVVYMLRWIQKVYFEAPSEFQQGWIDIKGREIAIALPLIFLVLWVGIYPSPIIKQIESVTEKYRSISEETAL